MQKPIIDCRSLLERQNEEFVPAAFQAITGRAPDIFGLIHYTQRLQRGASRELVLAEMRNSPEGLVYAVQAPSSELDQLLARYRRVRGLPLMGLRWFFCRALVPPFPALTDSTGSIGLTIAWARSRPVRLPRKSPFKMSRHRERIQNSAPRSTICNIRWILCKAVSRHCKARESQRTPCNLCKTLLPQRSLVRRHHRKCRGKRDNIYIN